MVAGPGSQVQCVRGAEPAPAAWDRFLALVGGAGPFHLPAWRRVMCQAQPSLRDLTLWLPDGGEIRAALPVLVRRRLCVARAASLPYGTPGGVWLRDPSDLEAVALLLDGFSRRFVRPWNDCVVLDHGPAEHAAVFARHWPSARVRAEETHRLDLPATVEELERGFERRTRKALRRASELGVTVREAGEAGVDEFVSLQAVEAARRGQAFTYPAALLRAGVGAGLLRVSRALRGGETLAVAVTAEGLGVWFAWLVAHAAGAREVPTGELLFGELLRDAVGRGLRHADLGSSAGREGPAFFKEGFGARTRGFRVWRSGPLASRGRRG
jgi:CelD/BcsL family acetyltransferase involved in cellulose biosynthesis